ncbi:hypothetical protein ABIA61_002680 [Paenibacillus sp. RC21]
MQARPIQLLYSENNFDVQRICKYFLICYTGCKQVFREKEGNDTSDEVSTLIFPTNCTVSGRRLYAATGEVCLKMRFGTYTFAPERDYAFFRLRFSFL